jgi:hypothetical protein
MGLRERWQTVKDKINEEFNPGLGTDITSDKLSRLRTGVGHAAFIDEVELTPPYGTPVVRPDAEVVVPSAED